MWIVLATRKLGVLLLVLLLGGFLGATLVRFAPGFEVDERQLDARRSEESLAALKNSRRSESNLIRFYAGYLAGAFHGDLGESRTFGRPVMELIKERAPTTLRLVGFGLAVGWLAGMLAAIPAAFVKSRALDFLLSTAGALFLSIPSALVGLAFLILRWQIWLALAVVVFPRVFRYARNLLVAAIAKPYVLAAKARGVGGGVIFLHHVIPQVGPPALALAGVSAAIALAADVPVEVLSDVPGIGQLAWQAAMGRDLPLLVSLTLLVTAVVQLSNTLADLAAGTWQRGRG